MEVPEGTLELPVFYDAVKTLAQTIEVDYFLPGCPPDADYIFEVVSALLDGRPLEEIPNLDIAKGVGSPLNMQPANVFVNPVTIFIPCPGETDLGILEIYVFNPAIGWQASWETDGCIVPGSRVNHGPNDPDPTEPPTIEVQLNHFSGVQAGKPTDPILPSAGTGEEQDGGGGGGSRGSGRVDGQGTRCPR